MRRRLEISRETERLVVVRRQGRPVTAQCEICGGEVRLVGLEEAALISGKSLRQLVRETDDKTVHYLETPDGLLLICLNSLIPSGDALNGCPQALTIQLGRKKQ